jgi:hypothetical protein
LCKLTEEIKKIILGLLLIPFLQMLYSCECNGPNLDPATGSDTRSGKIWIKEKNPGNTNCLLTDQSTVKRIKLNFYSWDNNQKGNLLFTRSFNNSQIVDRDLIYGIAVNADVPKSGYYVMDISVELDCNLCCGYDGNCNSQEEGIPEFEGVSNAENHTGSPIGAQVIIGTEAQYTGCDCDC